MCTVTLIPVGNQDFLLTSNRDEATKRKTLPPEFYMVNSTKMLFPKDAVAGGTWIGVSDKQTMVCLLNGGFIKHQRKATYRQSRGVVVKEFLEAEDLMSAMETYDCRGIEPFTIVGVHWKEGLFFCEMVWDGKEKHIQELAKTETYIWSSATLYTPEMKKTRASWFRDFEEENEVTPSTVLDFHKNAGVGNKTYDLCVDRGALKTISITQIQKRNLEVDMRYENLQSQEVHQVVFENENVSSRV